MDNCTFNRFVFIGGLSLSAVLSYYKPQSHDQTARHSSEAA